MAIHIDRITVDITQMDQALSHMLLKLLGTLNGAFGKKTVFSGGRANERQPRQRAKICLTDRISRTDALDVAKKWLPDELKSNLLGGNTCCFASAQFTQRLVKIKLHKVGNEKEAPGMSGRKTSSEKCFQFCVYALPTDFNALGFHGGIKDLNSLWGKQRPGTLFYFL